MHEGCSGRFADGTQALIKVRSMGFSEGFLPMPLPIKCECGGEFQMKTYECKCPHCNMTYAVTPCHAFDPDNVMKVGILD